MYHAPESMNVDKQSEDSAPLGDELLNPDVVACHGGGRGGEQLLQRFAAAGYLFQFGLHEIVPSRNNTPPVDIQ